MNRRQKIIVSVTGIFLVLLILVGLTYAFFITRIRGNTNPTSISVETANLELTYGDDDGSIIGDGMVIEPDTVIGEKTFTVTNNGNDTIDSYAVIVENLAVKYKETQTLESGTVTAGQVTSLVNGEDGNPDMKLVIECSSSVEGKTCNGMNGFLPEKSGILLTNTIEEDEIQTYKATLTYLDDGTNQSDDMNKTIEGRFNIIDTNNTVDIEGTVTGYTKGDFVQINSEEKESVIYPDGTYKFVGVKPDNHTITVRYIEDGEEKLRGTAPTENISIVKGDSAGVEGNVITITDLSRTVTIDVNASTNAPTVDNNIKDYNPFNEGTLAYNIYMNAARNSNGTKLVSTPPSKVAEEISSANWDLGIEEDVYYNDAYIKGYAETEDELYRCYFGYEDEVTLEWKQDCSGVVEYTSCTDNIEKKYVWDDYNSRGIYVNKCVDGEIVTGTAKYEKILSSTIDDLGTSYYFRGTVEDNYVTYADMCWRIVRINGDGSTKLILEDLDQVCSKTINGNWGIPTTTDGNKFTGNFGYTDPNSNMTGSNSIYIMDYLNGKTNIENSIATAFKNFQSTFTEAELSKLKSGNWCLGDAGYSRTGSSNSDYTYTLLNETQIMDNKIKRTAFNYDSYVRLSGENKDGFQPTLKCNGTIMNDWDNEKTNSSPMYVGTITADEIVYAGASLIKNNQNFYLLNNNYKSKQLNYNYFWSLSPSEFSGYFYGDDDHSFVLSYEGRLFGANVQYDSYAFRPSVSLKPDIPLSDGVGTIDAPYVIN